MGGEGETGYQRWVERWLCFDVFLIAYFTAPESRPRTPAHPQPSPLSCKRIALSARVESGAICCDVDAGRVPLYPFAHSAQSSAPSHQPPAPGPSPQRRRDPKWTRTWLVCQLQRQRQTNPSRNTKAETKAACSKTRQILTHMQLEVERRSRSLCLWPYSLTSVRQLCLGKL